MLIYLLAVQITTKKEKVLVNNKYRQNQPTTSRLREKLGIAILNTR